jgi:hypothetical protein
MPRLVVIDDTDPSIQYSGPTGTWFEADNTQMDTGIFGKPFLNTLHGVNVTASLSFNFSGMSRLLLMVSAFKRFHFYRCFQDRKSLFTGQA